MKTFFIVVNVLLFCFVSCKKETDDGSINSKFQGAWRESSAENVTLVVSKNPYAAPDINTFNLVIGSLGYPFTYRFNTTGDSIILSSGEGLNKPYKITFDENYRTFTIKKFHSTLPDLDPITFNKVH